MFYPSDPAAKDESSDSPIEGRYQRIRIARKAKEALLSRPKFSLRLQIYISFLLAFLISTGIASAVVVATYQPVTTID